jgi:hypothetical protein
MKISYVEGSLSLSTPGHPKLLEHSEAQAPLSTQERLLAKQPSRARFVDAVVLRTTLSKLHIA